MRYRTILKWAARALGATIALVLLVAAAGYGYSEVRLARHFTVPEHPIVLRTDSATLARGKRLVNIRGCVDCHGEDLGGRVMLDDPAVGRLASANLTSGGRGAKLTPIDWERAIRHGVRADGSALVVMPSQEFTTIADDEIEDMVSYIKSLPPVKSELPLPRAGPIIRALYIAGQVQLTPADLIDHSRSHATHVEAEPTAKYGEYLSIGCTGCHGPGLSGGKIPGMPPDAKPAANLTPSGLGRYTEADFVRALREGKRPDGSSIDPSMPWKVLGQMNDVELKALYAYLRTVPAREYGSR